MHFWILSDRQFEDAFEKTHSGDKWKKCNQYKFVLLDSYSVIFGGPNIIRIRIRSFLEDQIIFVFVFGYFRRTEYYSYSYSVIFGRPNNIRIRIRSFSEDRILFVFVFGHFWKTELYSYSYSVIFGRPNNIRIRIRSSKHYSLTSGCYQAGRRQTNDNNGR